MRGIFFSFDGIDGAGKSTQLRLLVEWLEQLGHRVLTCRDPGSTALGEALRRILLHEVQVPLGTRAEMLLYMASRAQLVEEVIQPALNDGQIVVSDRFLLANVVYQGHAGGLGSQAVWQVGEVATGGLQPAHTFLLDLDVDSAAQRLQRTLDRMEARGRAYLQRVRDGFLAEARGRPSAVTVLDALGSVDQIQAVIRQRAGQVLAQHASSISAP